MTSRVAITRALPQAEATAERVRALGAIPVLTPLLEIKARPFDTNISGAQALLFTSANGVRAFWFKNPAAHKINVLAIGDATAQAARTMGFAGVRSADGDVAALIEAARDILDPNDGALIHFSGAHVAGDLVGELRKAGFSAERRICYEAIAVAALPPALNEPLDIVLFHSVRGAETFVKLGAPGASHLTAACLSQAVADAAHGPRWRRVIVSPAPREDAFLRAALA